MTLAWINLSTRWGLASVQAALNVVISILGTAGIWAFSRYWWQRGTVSIVRDNSNVPLSAIFTLSSLGEGWDVLLVLRRQLFGKENWRLLCQLLVIVTVTFACTFSGPIAKVSLRSYRIIKPSNLEVRQTVKGSGGDANMLEANVFWNDTINSLDLAGFPVDQLLDYLPPFTKPWTYVAHEWTPTWSMTCDYTPETVLERLTGSGNYTLYDPVNAFPAYRDTYDPTWLDPTKYRTQADFYGWTTYPTSDDNPPFKDVLFIILIQSDPQTDHRMLTNNETLQISLSVLHAQNFRAVTRNDTTEGGASSWRPGGPVGHASFTRVECNITRKPEVPDENQVAWVWTNDTYSITMAYRTYWAYQIDVEETRNLTVITPTAENLLRFYQAYFVSVNTNYSLPSLRRVSIWMDNVQISVVFLAVVLILTCLVLWLTGRYFWFLRRYKSRLENTYIPDGKMEWMIHAARAAYETNYIKVRGERVRDRDHFRMASFGYTITDVESSDPNLQQPRLARVHSVGASATGGSPGSLRDSVPTIVLLQSLRHTVATPPSTKDTHITGEAREDIEWTPGFLNSHHNADLVESSTKDHHTDLSQSRIDVSMLFPKQSSKSLEGVARTNSTKSSFRSIVPDIQEEIDPIARVTDSAKGS